MYFILGFVVRVRRDKGAVGGLSVVARRRKCRIFITIRGVTRDSSFCLCRQFTIPQTAARMTLSVANTVQRDQKAVLRVNESDPR